MRSCSIAGCQAPHVAKGMCAVHYQRVRTTGAPGVAHLLRRPGNPDAIEKACTRCDVVKPLGEFFADKRTRDRRMSDCKACFTQRQNEMRRRRLYGMAPGDYERLVDEQAGRCAICQVETDRLCVDHDHDTGVVRALLCDACNTTLGLVADDPETLRRAAAYLEEHAMSSTTRAVA